MTMNEYWKRQFDSAMKEIHTTLPARIIKFYPEKMRADIQLLLTEELNGETLIPQPILNCPVQHNKAGNFIIRQPYRKDDLILVSFSEKAIDKLLTSGKPEKAYYERIFSKDDAVVIGGLKADNESDYSSANTEDLIIYHKENNSKIILKDSGDLILQPSGNIFLGAETAVEGASLGTSLKAWLDSHTHGNGNNGSPTTSPLLPSPAPSEKIKLI